MPSRRVAACVVTGFLGSGKTTLLKGLLDRAPSRDRIAVIVNEVGEIGIDGRVIGGFEFVENVVELASGCVCCSIDEYRFDLAVDELVRRLDPALLVIETSGVADPAPTLERLRRCGLGIDSVVTVVDARAWQAAWRVSRVVRRQIEAADFVVVSKRELIGERALASLRAKLKEWNPRALVLDGNGSEPFEGSELLLATSATTAARPAPASSGSHHHLEEDGIESFAWTAAGRFERSSFEKALEALPPEVLRAKGFLAREDGRGAWLFHLVCGRAEVTAFEGPFPKSAGAQGVFLGVGISRLQDRIVRELEASAAGPSAPAPTTAPTTAQGRTAG